MYHISAEKELQEGETFPPPKTDFTHTGQNESHLTRGGGAGQSIHSVDRQMVFVTMWPFDSTVSERDTRFFRR